MSHNSRRKFIKNSAASAAGFIIVPRFVLGGKGYVAPSDKLLIAAGFVAASLALAAGMYFLQGGNARLVSADAVSATVESVIDRPGGWSGMPQATYRYRLLVHDTGLTGFVEDTIARPTQSAQS